MCGIAGYYGRERIDEARIEAALALMDRRGPDAKGRREIRTRNGDHVLLLHSRLKIIDLDPRSNQPFELGAKVMAYNGELYNHVEVAACLAARPGAAPFRTTSDTEVLLRAIDEQGPAALDRCEGMWAFAVFDSADDSLLLARDRFGEKPLYLHRSPHGLYFGSEPKLVFALLGRRLPADDDHVKRFLVNGYKALHKEGRTFFTGLEELPAATTLRVGPEGASPARPYWTPRFEEARDMTSDEAVRGVRERLVESVRLRLRADVPISFCLSGGVDSNALIAIAKRVFGYDVHGFTILDPDPRYSEAELVRRSVDDLALRHTAFTTSTEEFLPRLRALVRYHDAPVYTLARYEQWLLMERIAAAGYRISVSGTAADELLSGYYDHHLFYLAAVRSDPDLHARALLAWTEHVRPIVRNPFLSDPERFVRTPAFRDHIFLDAEAFAGYLRKPWREPFAERALAPVLLRNRMANELLHEAVPPILHDDDLSSMYFSIENRSPFLDRALFEHCARIPTRHLVRDGRAKAVLRDAVRGIAPDAVLDSRRKVGFNAPIHSFLDVRDVAVRRSLLSDGPIFDLLDRGKVEALIDKPSLPNSESKFLFSFISAKLFLEEFL